tara:strand:- start:147 stop:329 length:183 start_codon:yes stop_codon:yes gene_type:complete
MKAQLKNEDLEYTDNSISLNDWEVLQGSKSRKGQRPNKNERKIIKQARQKRNNHYNWSGR